jgi:mono/diheme cytochrome c family protein
MRTVAAIALAVSLGAFVFPGIGAQPQTLGAPPWRSCCGARPWPQGGGMMGGGMMGGSMQRHRVAMMGGVPEPYTNASDPLPRTAATVERGAAIYAANCAMCHGATGLGDGPAAQNMDPQPANLAWLSNMPMSRWDPFMYWTVAEGGARFGTGMPAFKGSLAKDDIWAAIAYIQAHLPRAAGAGR